MRRRKSKGKKGRKICKKKRKKGRKIGKKKKKKKNLDHHQFQEQNNKEFERPQQVFSFSVIIKLL